MKRLLNIILYSAVLMGCVAESTGIRKLEAFGDRYVEGVRGGGVPVHPRAEKDTVVYMTGVEFPEGYDWRRDSSFGEVNGRLVLFRDSIRVLEIPAGAGSIASLAPDLHHLCGGHIYTESCTEEGTVIGRDGEMLFSYPGRELLCGLLVEGDDVYTLGRSRSGQGFSLRRNGVEVFSRPDGGIAAQFSARPDYPSGALYRDERHMCFSYWRPSGDDKEWYVVKDGTESPVAVPDGRMYDIRIRDGVLDISPVKSSAVRVFNYVEGSWKSTVVVSKVGGLTIYSPLWPTYSVISGQMLFLSFRNASLFGHRLYMALNPLDDDEAPFLWRDGQSLYSLGLHGFVTEVVPVEESVPDGDKDDGAVGIAADFH